MDNKRAAAGGAPDVYSHASKVMSHVVTHYPHKALDMVEEVSFLLKGNRGINPGDFLKTDIHKDYAKASDEETKKIT